MRRFRKALAMTAVAICASSHAGEFQSANTSGFWQSPARWTLVSGTDANNDGIPGAGDTATISHSIAMNGNVTCDGVTVLAGGSLFMASYGAVAEFTHTFGSLTLNGGTVYLADGREAESVTTNVTGDVALLGGGKIVGSAFGSLSTISLNVGVSFLDTNNAGSSVVQGAAGTVWTLAFTGNAPSFMVLTAGATRTFSNITVDAGKTVTLSGVFLSTAAGTKVLVNGRLNLGNNGIAGSGNVEVSSTGVLGVGAPSGGLNSNLQNSGTKTFDPAAGFAYNNTSFFQDTGSLLPAQVGSLLVENPTRLTLTNNVQVADTLHLVGNLVPGANLVTVGTSPASPGSITGSGMVLGSLKRFVAAAPGNVAFPLGNNGNSRGVSINFTEAPAVGGSLTVAFSGANPGEAGLPLTDGALQLVNVAPEGFWSVAALDGLAGGTYEIAINIPGFNAINDINQLRVVKRTTSGSAWTLEGSAGSNSGTTIVRTGLTSFSEFGAAGPSGSLPVAVSAFTID